MELVVAGERHQTSHSDAQREKDLTGSVGPDLLAKNNRCYVTKPSFTIFNSVDKYMGTNRTIKEFTKMAYQRYDHHVEMLTYNVQHVENVAIGLL